MPTGVTDSRQTLSAMPSGTTIDSIWEGTCTLIRKGLRPKLSLHLWGFGGDAPYREVFSFGRSWTLIALLFVFDAVFLFPVINVFHDAANLWRQSDQLFQLTGALFMTFWLLGWSILPLLATLILLLLLFGREEVRARPGELEVIMGLPFIGARMTYQAASIRNLRIVYPLKKSGKYWRGSFVMFDYGANTGEFGSGLQEGNLTYIRERIESAAGMTLRDGYALPEELAGKWLEAPLPPVQPFTAIEERVTLTSSSSLLLIIANVIPILGAIFWNWDLGVVMLLYWSESAVIGFFNVGKIIVVSKWGALVAAPFFLGHFGGFMAIHFMFLYTFFLKDAHSDPATKASLDDVAALFIGLWPAMLALVISHGYSFFHNYVGRREYVGRTGRDQMSEPYRRIIFMHLVIIFGGGLTMILGNAIPVLMGVIVLKTVFDLRAHLKQRKSP
jgi:hypothetical protein